MVKYLNLKINMYLHHPCKVGYSMISIEVLILFLIAASAVSYLLTKLNTFVGSMMTTITTFFTLIVLLIFGLNQSLESSATIVNFFSFEPTYLGLFFSIVITFIYFLISFAHHCFLSENEYKDVYNFLFLLSLAGVIGSFFTDNFLQLFFFFELIVWSTAFLIPLGKSKKAAVTYFGFSIAGSFAMLFGILLLGAQVGSFDISYGLENVSGVTAVIVFISFLFSAFAKLGLFPLHTWLPITHGNAPHTFSPVLSGALVKIGAFIAIFVLIKMDPVSELFVEVNLPSAHYFFALLGSLSIILGTIMAIRSDDAKQLLAYSSMSHGGYILIAFSMLSSVAFASGFYHIVAHALASAGAFLAIAAVARQVKTTDIKGISGVLQKMPITYVVYLISVLSLIGIPLTGGFISKWLLFKPIFYNGWVFIGIAGFIGSIGSILYVFRPLSSLLSGQEQIKFDIKIKEAPLLMLIPMIIITFLNVYTGLFPHTLLTLINKVISELGYPRLDATLFSIAGYDGVMNPFLIGAVFLVGILISFLIFITLKYTHPFSSENEHLNSDTICQKELLYHRAHYFDQIDSSYRSVVTKMSDFYSFLTKEILLIGKKCVSYFMSNHIEIAILWIIILLATLLLGGLL